jgi:hypothetical protein
LDLDNNLKASSKSKSKSKFKDKDSFMQCYYCCKHSHRVTKYRLRERARKLCNYKQKDKKALKDEAAVNAAIATTTKDANEATISDASI